MAITLQQPLGSDIYSIAIFNSNAQIIQEAINTLQTSVENINEILPNKFQYFIVTDTSINIDSTTLENGIYYMSNTPSGTLPDNLPSTNNILINSNLNDNLSQYLLSSNGKLYQRTVTSNSIGTWGLMTVQIVDSLDIQDSQLALSANQGYVLNKNKISIYYYNNNETDSLDVDNVESGIYVCDNIQITGTLPGYIIIDNDNPTNNHVIFETYGNIDESIVVQYLIDKITQTQSTRLGYIDTTTATPNFIWTDWSRINIGESGGGGGDNNIRLELVEL